MASPVPPSRLEFRRRVLRVIVISLILDLLSFTFILPLLPNLLEFYRDVDRQAQSSSSSSKTDSPTVLAWVLSGINAYKNAFSRPINDRYDIVLLGGFIGSIFSLCQTIASPIIGHLSDRYGRRRALLWSMCGNAVSVALWLAATDFRTFLASRVVGGLSEGNVQLAMAMATDVSDESQRSGTMAMIGICFSVAFTFGPAIGAALSRWTVVKANPFAASAGVSLGLILTETAYLYFCLPETLPAPASTTEEPTVADQPESVPVEKKSNGGDVPSPTTEVRNSKTVLHITHFLFILTFAGIEFSLPFMTYDLFGFDSIGNGRLLGLIGIIASVLQGTFTRRVRPLRVVQVGTASCAAAFWILSTVDSLVGLYVAAGLLAVTSATVVTGLNSLSSLEARADERGRVLGKHRSSGQLGRTLGPVLFCSLYWWAGRTTAYRVGMTGMVGVLGLVFGLLVNPTTDV